MSLGNKVSRSFSRVAIALSGQNAIADSVGLVMIGVILPSLGVGLDVFCDFQIGGFVPNDVFVVIALPYG